MKGYVMNKSNIWMHAMKRAVGPGQKIDINELFEQYGAKHDLAEGEEFAQWLRNVKLKDANKWSIVVTEPKKEKVSDESEEVVKVEKKEQSKFSDTVTPLVPAELGVADVVGLSVRKGREVLPKIMDLKLLKYAYEEARQLAGKDSLCREIKKRIRALQIAR